MNNVINTVKTFLGLEHDYYDFDDELLIHITAACADLYEIGVIKELVPIVTLDTKWDEIIDNAKLIPMSQLLAGLTVKLHFDSNSTTSAVLDSIKSEIARLTWTLKVMSEEETNG